MSVLKDFLPKELEDKLEEIICYHKFPWYWRPSTTYGIYEEGKESKDYQFVHIMYHENTVYSEAFELAREVLFKFELKTGMKIKDLIRIKANLTTPTMLTDAELDDAIHIDAVKEDGNYYSIIYYVMDSDGDTILCDEDKKHIAWKAPIKGTAVYFPSHQWHRHTPPKRHKRRVVINFIVEIE